MAGLVAEDERTFVRAAERAGVPYIVPTVSTADHGAVFAAAAPGQTLAYQFYLLGCGGCTCCLSGGW